MKDLVNLPEFQSTTIEKMFKINPSKEGFFFMFDLNYIQKISKNKINFAGVDEVGRGPLAGPVVSTCVLIQQKKFKENEIIELLQSLDDFGVNDSKKLTAEKRRNIIENFGFELVANQKMTVKVSDNLSLSYFIQEISEDLIDEINILNASLKSMELAFLGLDFEDGIILIDGNKKFKTDKNVLLETVIKGDSKSLIIGLASIIAKEYRDQLMNNLAKKYPQYGWEQNAGYGTKKHLESIVNYGVTKYHRKTFKGVKEVYEQRGTI